MAKSSKSRKAPRRVAKARSGRTTRLIDLNLSGGPKKKRPTGTPTPRTTTHKKRAAWFKARVAWPYRERSAHALLGERSRTAAALPPQTGSAQWELVGPTNVGGRMTSVVYAPKKPSTIWVGAAGGGVWKSDDGGQHCGERCGTANQLLILAHWPSILRIHPSCTVGLEKPDLSADSYPGVRHFPVNRRR